MMKRKTKNLIQPAFQLFLLVVCFVILNYTIHFVKRPISKLEGVFLLAPALGWLLSLFLFMRWRSSRWLSLNVVKHRWLMLRSLSLGVCMGLVSLLLLTLLQKISPGLIGDSGSSEEIDQIVSSLISPAGGSLLRAILSILAFSLWACFLAPFLEELIFRKYLLTLLAKWRVPLYAALVSSVFSLLHRPNSVAIFLLYFFISLQLNKLYLQTGSLRASYLCHAGYNSMLLLISFLSKKGMLMGEQGNWLVSAAGVAILYGALPAGLFFTKINIGLNRQAPKLRTMKNVGHAKQKAGFILGLIIAVFILVRVFLGE